jgi:tight adherence protein C
MPFPIDTGLPTEELLPLLLIFGVLAVGLVMIYSASGERSKSVGKRIDKILGQPTAAASKADSAKHRRGARVLLKETQKLTEAEHRQIMRGFARLGVPAEAAVTWFKATRAIFPAVFVLATLPLTKGLLLSFPAAGLLAMAVPAAIGWLLPMMLVRRSIARRNKAVSAGLPDALELLAVCIEAGLSLENGLQRVAGELKRSQPELGDELSITWAEINILPDRDQALLNFAERVNVASVKAVVSTLSQTLRYGTPLARSLRVVATEVRNDQLTAMEEKANRLPALMTIPVMLFIMPTIFLIIGGPPALKLMDVLWGK